MTQPEKRGVSRRGFAKYVVGLVAALAAAVAGYGVLVRKKQSPRYYSPHRQLCGRRHRTIADVARTVPQGYADLILMNGNVLTVDPSDTIVDAVAVKDGCIQAAGSYSELKQFVGPLTKQVDLRGKTITPGACGFAFAYAILRQTVSGHAVRH